MKKGYISAEKLVPRRKKIYDEKLLEYETMRFLGFLKDCHELPSVTYNSAAIEKETLACFRKDLAAIGRL